MSTTPITQKSSKLHTFQKLGLKNVVTVAYYRWQLRSGYFAKKIPMHSWSGNTSDPLLTDVVNVPIIEGPYQVPLFNERMSQQSSPPDWLANPYYNACISDNEVHWSLLRDFDPGVGDIKTIWELSRSNWLGKACWQA